MSTRQRISIAAALTAAAIVALVVALLWPPPADNAWDTVQNTGQLVFAVDATYPPFAAIDANGAFFGFDIDVATAVAQHLGVAARFDLVSYDGLLGTLTVGRTQAVISAFTRDDTRLHQARYTQPYFNAGTVLVLPNDSPPPATDPQVWATGRTVAVAYGAHGDVVLRGWAQRAAAVTSLALPDEAAALNAVAAGGADAALIDGTLAYEYLSQYPTLRIVQAVEDRPYVIAVHPESPRLLAALNDALTALENDGTLVDLRAHWFGEAARELRWVDAQ